MSYSIQVSLSPHADPALTVRVMTQNAVGERYDVGYLSESVPSMTISVPTGYSLLLYSASTETHEIVHREWREGITPRT